MVPPQKSAAQIEDAERASRRWRFNQGVKLGRDAIAGFASSGAWGGGQRFAQRVFFQRPGAFTARCQRARSSGTGIRQSPRWSGRTVSQAKQGAQGWARQAAAGKPGQHGDLLWDNTGPDGRRGRRQVQLNK